MESPGKFYRITSYYFITETVSTFVDRKWLNVIIFSPFFSEKINGHNEEAGDETKKAANDCGVKDAAVCETKETESEMKDIDCELKEATADGEMKEAECETKDEVANAVVDSPPVEFTIIHNKDKYTVSMPVLSTIRQLKEKLVDMIGVSSQMQKIMIKGLAKDDQTLESLNVNSSSKIMVVGAKLQDIVAVSVANIDEVWEIISFNDYCPWHF